MTADEVLAAHRWQRPVRLSRAEWEEIQSDPRVEIVTDPSDTEWAQMLMFGTPVEIYDGPVEDES